MSEKQNSVMAEVITDLTKSAIKAIYSKVATYYRDISEMDAIDFGKSYEKYLEVASNKICMIKTLIYRKEPRNLYSLYESLNLTYHGNMISSDKVNNILDFGHKIIITGTAGMGKTTLLKHVFLTTIKQEEYIPVFVELRGVNNEEVKYINVLDLIYAALTNCGFSVDKKYFEYSMEAGKYLILFDGFDEVKAEKSFSLGKGIRELCTKYPDNYYIMSSRPLEQFVGWNDFVEMQTVRLDKMQALNLITKLEYDQVTKEKFIYELNNGLYEKYQSFASNPLLLTIMLMTFDEGASIPDKLNDFYEQAFSTLFNVHDGSKDCFKRDIKTGLGLDDFKTVFSYFCFKSYFNSEYEFTESSVRKYLGYAKEKCSTVKFKVDDYLSDLINSVCMLVKDGLVYAFSHRSFQEYFAASYTTKLEDVVQQRLITGWLTEKKGYSNDPYFLMLFNMQPDKFNKVILCPGLKRIEGMYSGQLTLFLLKSMFDCVRVRVRKSGESKEYSFALGIKDNYLCGVLSMTCRFNQYDFDKFEVENEAFIDYATKGRSLEESIEISFEDIEADGRVDELICQYCWLDRQIVFAMKVLEEYNRNGIKSKRKVSSIIDSL